MIARDVMTRDVVSVTPDTPVRKPLLRGGLDELREGGPHRVLPPFSWCLRVAWGPRAE
jgi:hypothetical protein